MRRYVINLVCIIGFCFLLTWCIYAEDDYLGEYSSNPYDSDSVSNPYGQYGSEFSPDSINNPFGQYGNPYSPNSATNPYATDTPKLYSSDGKYLGKVSANPYDPDSISNPFGIYGSPYSPDSVNNPFGQYGSPYSPNSATNPFAIEPPKIYAPKNDFNSYGTGGSDLFNLLDNE